MSNNILNLLKPILVIDNNEDDFGALITAFKRTGLPNPILQCRTGHEALGCLKEKTENLGKAGTPCKPAIILLDLDLPDIDGLQLLQLIRENGKLQQTPIIIWTSSSHERDVNACYHNGAQAYMRKPDNPENLIESIRRLKEYWFQSVILPSR